MLVRCLYASRCVPSQTPGMITDIVAQSRRNNPSRGITGLLCRTSSSFVQVLEGGRDEVSALLCSIMLDDRHQEVRLMSFEEIDERYFGSWSMGQVELETVNRALLLKYAARPDIDPFSGSARATMALLMELVASGAIVNRQT